MYEVFDHHEEYRLLMPGSREQLVRENRKAVAIPAYRGNFRILYRTDDKIVRECIQSLWEFFVIAFSAMTATALVGLGVLALIIYVGETPSAWSVGVMALAVIAAAGIFAVKFRGTVDSVLDKYDRYPESITVEAESSDPDDGQQEP